jgi:hypothetical protein
MLPLCSVIVLNIVLSNVVLHCVYSNVLHCVYSNVVLHCVYSIIMQIAIIMFNVVILGVVMLSLCTAVMPHVILRVLLY